ncbi:MAG: ribosome-associated translation inhibitor RaiA [Solobacterium sp.]|jgi:putative sigma-54 modulation protein|nr:ribosome-associated translation inhibitor RaiA [Solobacterium sp.]MCH4223055.1 ribosome-associated translation inhibitor RaiA [Solobacterium sp.]
MKFEIVGKNVTVTEAMRNQIEKKLSNLDKYLLIDPNTTARVVTRVYPNSQKVEVTIPTKVGILRTEVMNNDLYAAIDLAVDKLEDQIRRQKTRLSRRHKESLSDTFIEEDETETAEENDIPVKTKSVHADTLDLDEAIMQMELSGHEFYIYTDEESGKVSVVYQRKDGQYGLIEVDQ